MHRACALSCRWPLLALALVACHEEPRKPAVAPPAASSSAVVVAPPSPPRPPPAPPPSEPGRWDFEHVHRVTVTKDQRGPAGAKPAKDRRLHEVSRFPWPLAPPLGIRLPQGAAAAIPSSFDGATARSTHLSNGKLLLVYGGSHLVVVDYASGMVEHALDLDSPDVPLTANERETDNMGRSAYASGVVFVCRDWNERVPARAGYVDAIDLATGALRWRSVPQACSGGTAAALGDYVLMGNGGTLKLLRVYDGVVVHQITNLGNINDIRIEDPNAVVETTKWGLQFELR